ncbi:Hamartin protein-domain-containing protein [Sparassis latifolia]
MTAITAELSRQLRLLLESPPDALSVSDVLALADAFVLECSSASESQWPSLLAQLEDGLQRIYDVLEYAHYEIFIAVLYRLRPILPPPSIISTWFDLVLRPALRDPKLGTVAVDHARELIISALDSDPADFPIVGTAEERGKELQRRKEKVGEFRRRLMDLYLLDAFNESSGEDILEWAELSAEQREQKSCWKMNLEVVLVKFGLERPEDFLTVLYHCFGAPSSRLQLLILLNSYISQPAFPLSAAVFAAHPLATSLLHCMLFDNSSSECTIGLTVFTKLLPILAVKACQHMKRHLPHLLAVLARIVCWRVRRPAHGEDEQDDSHLHPSVPAPPIREDIGWVRLEQTFEGSASSAPSPHRYFTFLYYLFPCNVIRFLRYPVTYLKQNGLDSPYAVDWDEALDEDQIRSRSEPLLRGHVLHPLLIWREASEELEQPDFWMQYDITRIVGDCTMLDVRNTALGMREREHSPAQFPAGLFAESSAEPSPSATASPPEAYTSTDALSPPSQIQEPPTPMSAVTSLAYQATEPSTPVRVRVSLQDMITTSIALKSGRDIEIADPSPAWSATLFPLPPTRSPSREASEGSRTRIDIDTDSLSMRYSDHGHAGEDVPSHVAQAIAGLQREVLLLRNELNFELWMARENVKHIGRLYEDRVLSKTAEAERQGLHNKLREYKSEVYRLQRELKEHKEQASSVKNQYADWNRKLQDKVMEFRNEKKSWMSEAAAMRAADREAKDAFAAQGKQLAEAVQKIFQLETKIKETAPRIDRLHDYEKQIEQLIKLQRLWELDVQKLNEQADSLQVFTSQYRKMELRVECFERTLAESEQIAQTQRHQIKTLESRLLLSHRQMQAARKGASLGHMSQSQAEFGRLSQTNQKLRDENAELQDEVEEMKAMVELLKAQVSDTQGLISDSRSMKTILLSGLVREELEGNF